MLSVRAVLSRFCRKKVDLRENDLSPDEYNMRAVNDRVYRAIIRVGKTRAEVATMYGMDANIPLAMHPPEKVPRPTMENVVKLAGFLGVSVRWILYGEPENDVDLFVMGQQQTGTAVAGAAATNGAAIITGAHNSTVVVQNFKGHGLTDCEREMIRVFRQLPVRDRAAVVSYVLAFEHQEPQK